MVMDRQGTGPNPNVGFELFVVEKQLQEERKKNNNNYKATPFYLYFGVAT